MIDEIRIEYEEYFIPSKVNYIDITREKSLKFLEEQIKEIENISNEELQYFKDLYDKGMQ